MTRLLQEKTVCGFYGCHSGHVYKDLAFMGCRFNGCSFGYTRNPYRRPTARRVSITNCRAVSCRLGSPILEDVLVNGLTLEGSSLHNILYLWAPALKHVTLAGHICDLLINGDADPAGDVDPVNGEFRRANAEYYATVDWALDIKDALFANVEIRGIPVDLIRRDPETQVAVRRETVLKSNWRELDLTGTHVAGEIEWFLERGEPDHVLIAPRRMKGFRRFVECLRLLQREGVAEEE